MSVVKSRKKKVEAIEIQESTSPTINDMPPEVLEIILMRLDCGKISMLPYRVVHSSWKSIIDEHLEKRSLKGDIDGCSQAIIVEEGRQGILVPRIQVSQAILQHPGNPFPFRSLLVTRKSSDQRGENDKRISITTLASFTTKFGSHLNTFELARVYLKFGDLIQILSALSNLRILKLSRLHINLSLRDNIDSFPSLPHLTTLQHTFLFVRDHSIERENQFFVRLLEYYSDHLVTLRLGPNSNYVPLPRYRPYVEHRCFQKLEQLKIYNPTASFLRLSCVPPLKHLSIVCLDEYWMPTRENVDVKIDRFMSFANKFCNTLESLYLDISWDDAFSHFCRERHGQLCGIIKTKSVIFPKLTKFSIAYPTHSVEVAIIKKLFLVKFPVLGELHFLHFKFARDIDLLTGKKRNESCRKTDNDIIKEFLLRENYSEKCTKLNRISVWFTAEEKDAGFGDDNDLVYTTRVQVGE